MKLTKKQVDRYNKYLDKQKEARLKQIERVRSAAAQGDLSENAEFDAANLELAKINSRITLLEEALSDYTIVDTSRNKGNNIITIGSILRIGIMSSVAKAGVVSYRSTGIKTLDFCDDEVSGEWYEIVESSPISIPKEDGDDNIMELTVTSLVGRLLYNKPYKIDSPSIFNYTDNDNTNRVLKVMEVRTDD